MEAVAQAAPIQLEMVASYNPMTGAVKPEPIVEEKADLVKEEPEPIVLKAEPELTLNSVTLNQIQSFTPAPVSQTKKSIIGTMAAGAVLAASGTGGFGNKQTSMAFTLPNIIYKDILVHCVHVSIQEQQKKMKMFQKKVTKKRFFDIVLQPELQYLNIYKEPVKRLSCFKAITD
jgi:hypothetical protein